MGTKRVTGTYKRRAYTASRQSVAKAAELIRKRMAGSPRAPLATRGFRGAYSMSSGAPELKFVDNITTVIPVPNASWTVTFINGVTQGTDYNQRIGRKMTNKSILFNGLVYNNQGNNINATLGVMLRIVLIYDTQVNSTLPAGTDIFAVTDVLSPMNLVNRDRFKVIFDIRKQVGAYTTSAGGSLATGSPQNAMFSKYKKCMLETINSGTNNTIGSVSTGAFYVCYIADTNNAGCFNFYTRVRYVDN